jgi:subtilisin-like proprotein convertase family protein
VRFALQELSPGVAIELEAISPAALLEADRRSTSNGPLQYAVPSEVSLSPSNAGTWSQLDDGRWLWRLVVEAPGATDLNFGFTDYRLPPGAELWIVGSDGTARGPFTAADNLPHHQLWTPVVPGSKATIELLVPSQSDAEPVLLLTRIGRGYRDVFGGNESVQLNAADCHIDAVCPEVDPWRDQVRSAGQFSLEGGMVCSGLLLADPTGADRALFLTADHCGVREENADTVVVYWSFQSPACGQRGGGTADQFQGGATIRHRSAANDLAILELDELPPPEYGVYASGWDAREETWPQSTIKIHHPQATEKAFALEDEPLVLGGGCVWDGGPVPAEARWMVDGWAAGGIQKGSSGSGLWDADTGLVVGVLSGGGDGTICTGRQISCDSRLAYEWSTGGEPLPPEAVLDPAGTGRRVAAGRWYAPYIASVEATDSCGLGLAGGNGSWEPGETIELAPALGAADAFDDLRGTVRSQTPGVDVVQPHLDWSGSSAVAATTPPASKATVTVDESVACGTPIELEVEVTATGAGPWSIPIRTTAGTAGGTPLPISIADGSQITVERTAAAPAPIEDLDVRVAIDHPRVGDLLVILEAPDGTHARLVERPGIGAAGDGGCGDADLDVVFDDEAVVDLTQHCEGSTPWYEGRARPHTPLSVFDGHDANGTWRLIVADLSLGETGELLEWSLDSAPTLTTECRPCSVSDPELERRAVAGVARLSGALGSEWRSEAAVLNDSGAAANLRLAYVADGTETSRDVVVPDGGQLVWDDPPSALFGVDHPSAGALQLFSDRPVELAVRTFNRSDSGTYGQFLPGVAESEALAAGERGVLMLLRGGDGFRSNVGAVNLTDTPCTLAISIRGTAGEPVDQVQLELPAAGWKQHERVLRPSGAELAWATVEVIEPSCRAWPYASVVDELTGDPTTVPLQRPEEAIDGRSAIAGVAHVTGVGGAPWVSSLALLNPTETASTASLRFVADDVSVSSEVELGAGELRLWDDVVAGLFGVEADVAGAVLTESSPHVLAAVRTFTTSKQGGSYGQWIPGVRAGSAATTQRTVALPLLRRDRGGRTNVGAVNLTDEPCELAIDLRDELGQTLVTVPLTLPPDGWTQANRVFEGHQADGRWGSAVVRVLTPGCHAWPYASVIDGGTGDPTTVPARPGQ